MPWVGGKFYLAKWIISHFPNNYEDMIYVEPFGGAAWVLLKKKPSKLEVYNDLDRDLVNLVRVLISPSKFREFKERAKWVLHCRELCYEAHKKREFEDDIDRALWFAISVVQSFSGARDSWSHSVRYKKTNPWNAFYSRLDKIFERLRRVQVENLDYKKVIDKYDSKETLFYIDPPYLGCKYYKFNWNITNYIELAEILKSIEGKFLLSHYYNEKLIELFNWCNYELKDSCVYAAKSDANGKDKKVEMLIKNF